MNTIAMCVMSHNHPESVEHVLESYGDVFKACELDIYYYDSSYDDRVKEIVNRYVDKGYDNLFYIPCQGISGDQKLGLLYSCKQLKHDYDYVWVVKDRTACDSRTILTIYQEALFEKPDLIVIDTYGDNVGSGTVTYTDAPALYRDYAWEITSMDVTLFKVSTMLKGYEPHDLPFDKDDPRSSFMQYDHIFRRLAQMDSLKVRVISDIGVRILNSEKSGSMWADQIFDVWVDLWSRENESLPSIYEVVKSEVMKSEAVPAFLRSEEGLLELKKRGILSKEKLTPEIQRRWSLVSQVPYEKLLEISN